MYSYVCYHHQRIALATKNTNVMFQKATPSIFSHNLSKCRPIFIFFSDVFPQLHYYVYLRNLKIETNYWFYSYHQNLHEKSNNIWITHSNDLLNFYVINNVQNADNITKFKTGLSSDNKLHQVYANGNFSVNVRR